VATPATSNFMVSIEVKLATGHLVIGTIKGMIFAMVGYQFGGGYLPGLQLVGATVLVVFVTLAMEFMWFFVPNRRLHREMEREFGSTYKDMLIHALEEHSMLRVIVTKWIGKTYSSLSSSGSQ